jgi:hypothetical protein
MDEIAVCQLCRTNKAHREHVYVPYVSRDELFVTTENEIRLLAEVERLRTELTALRTAGDRLANAVETRYAYDGEAMLSDALAAYRTARKDTP